MTIKRRDFLKLAGVSGVGLVSGASLKANTAEQDGEFMGMLIDTTMCGGCRSCEIACNEKNKLPEPEIPLDDESVFESLRDTNPDAFVVVNKYPNEKDPDWPVFRRRQCMHCNQPACASACLVKALEKTRKGPIIYDKNKCMGCRYCMISCPFDVPKFNYDSPAPTIRKCSFCYDRQKEGKIPACAEACPTGATQFGTRRELMEIAKERIYTNPDQYVPHIYGEHEVGGTGWLYLSSVPFEKIGFRTDLGKTAYPELTSGFLSSVPYIFVLWPAFLLGLNHMSKRNMEKHDEEQD